jgi:hypothetical protein
LYLHQIMFLIRSGTLLNSGIYMLAAATLGLGAGELAQAKFFDERTDESEVLKARSTDSLKLGI